MADILTQTEIDALINALVDDAPGQSPRLGRDDRQKKTRAYDFRRPDKFSKEQLRALQMIHENMVRGLTTYFSATFRSMVQMVVGSVDQYSYSDFIRFVSNPTALCLFNLKPLTGTCLLDINPALAFPMLDRLFGGPGTAMLRARDLTDIEKTVIARVVSGTLVSFRDSWANVIKLEPAVLDIETNPLFLQVAAPNDMVVTVAIDVRVGEHVGVMTLCLPYVTLEPILAKLSAKHWFAAGAQQESDLNALHQRLGTAMVPVSVELGRSDLSVREIVGLDTGDILMLDRRSGERLLVRVDDRPKFMAQPGQRKGRVAVQIESVLTSEEVQGDHE